MKIPGKLTFLFLGGAKRVAMARLLAEAAEAEGLVASFVSYELSKDCAIASVATVVEGLRWNDANLFRHLTEVVENYHVDIVLPFVDAAVAVATLLAQKCPGLFTPGADGDLQNALFDKVSAAELFEKHHLPIPQTYKGDPLDKCWIAKPRLGSASRGIVFLSADEAANFDNSDQKFLIQECFHKREEISVDCYAWPSESIRPIISPRKRLEVMGGEAIKTVTVEDEEVVALSRQILRTLGLVGPVTIQFLRDLDSRRLMLMEINPRLGGACTASVKAGADIPRCIVRDALALDPLHFPAKPNVLVCRYLTDVIINPNE